MKNAFVILLLLIVTQLQAQHRIGSDEAFTTAERFIAQSTKQNTVTLTLTETIKSEQSGQANLFVFSIEPTGFVIVSATNDVLAYSFSSTMPQSIALPAHINYWLDLYNQATDYLIAHPDAKQEPTTFDREVGPLMNSCWGQGCFHNEACPVDSLGPCDHASAGCVAIAMAQILYYHKYPLTGEGEVSYNCSPYGTLSANFGETTYHWDEMADTLHDSNPAVAQLIYHCGLAVKMHYSAHESYSYFSTANNALRNHFRFPTANLKFRTNYDDERWMKLIKQDLDKLLPVYYRGVSSLGGHAFVCDGYDANGLFHFNFGWDGVADGYYTLSNPSGFSSQQVIIHDILPINNIPIHSDEHNIVYVSPDGTGDGSSWVEATNDLQGALFNSHFNDYVIWVKEGSFKGDPSNEYAFLLMHNSRIYGGFKGDEPFDYDLSLRDFEAHPCILDGDHRQGVINVLPYVNSDEVVIDGFIIQNGVADEGGGLLLSSHTTLSNCKICNNSAFQNGGGISTSLNSVDIQVINCDFFGNEAKDGGAIHDKGGITFRRCNIHDNIASNNGGGINSSGSSVPSVYINCTVNNNSALKGGGIYSNQSRSSYWSCLLNNNTAENGGGCYGESNFFNCTIVRNKGSENYGGIYNTQITSHEIKNCIIWGNVSQGEYEQIGPIMNLIDCAVQNEYLTPTSNLWLATENDGDSPNCYVRFVDPTVDAGCEGHGGNWRLQSRSTCINRGDSITQQPDTDMDGNPRLRHGKVDLGAYETNTASHLINLDFCETAPYYHDSVYIPMPGTYTFLYPGASYDSLVILNMTVENILLKEEICELETYDFFGESLNEAGLYSTVFDCKNYQLELTVNPVFEGNITEITLCEGDTYDFHGTILNEAGLYTDTLDCAIYKLDLTIKPTPIYNTEKSICKGERYYFFGTLLDESGHYYNEVPCTGKYYLDLNVQPLPLLQCSNDTTVVLGTPAILEVAGADSYLWSTGDTTTRIVVYPEVDQYYEITGSFENGCSSSKRIRVKVVEENKNEDICLFPNPANDKVNIYKKNIDEVTIFNVLGEPVERISAHRVNTILDVSQYESGIYIVMVRVLNNRYYTKLIIQH